MNTPTRILRKIKAICPFALGLVLQLTPGLSPATLWAGYQYDYSTADPNALGWASAKGGIRRWNVQIGKDDGGHLGQIVDGLWRQTPYEWVPGTTQVLWGSSTGLRVWDAESNTDLGVYNNATGGWSRATSHSPIGSDQSPLAQLDRHWGMEHDFQRPRRDL